MDKNALWVSQEQTIMLFFILFIIYVINVYYYLFLYLIQN